MIIGINAGIGGGKDTTAQIIQYLISYHNNQYKHPINESDFNSYFKNKHYIKSTWQVRKFADKLKDIVCLLIGCTREQLEDRAFRDIELGEEWWYYTRLGRLTSYLEDKHFDYSTLDLVKLTPRKLLQLLGTEAGRNIIHPDIWINATLNEYKPTDSNINDSILDMKDEDKIYPNWLITDLRFFNEYNRLRKYEDTMIVHVYRPLWQRLNWHKPDTEEDILNQLKETNVELYKTLTHSSETEFESLIRKCDVVIDNSYDIDNLIEEVNTKIIPLLK